MTPSSVQNYSNVEIVWPSAPQGGKVSTMCRRFQFRGLGLILSLADSTVLAYVMKILNDRYNYGLDLYLLSIDEGITGYRDDSLEVIKCSRPALVHKSASDHRELLSAAPLHRRSNGIKSSIIYLSRS
jgi:hypothetical protein